MSKHTPGPWVPDYVRVNAPAFHVEDPEADADGKPNTSSMVALVYAPNWQDRDAQQANARLIAAAPEMLTALYEVAHHSDDERGFMVDVRAAIAKATGEPR